MPDGFHSKRKKGVALVTDQDDGSKPDYDLAEDSKAGVVDVSKDADGTATHDGQTINEGPEMGPQTGWAPKFGWPIESVTEGESLLDHQTWLEGKIPDKYYGGKLLERRAIDRL